MMVVVFGANGLLGSNLVATAVEQGHDVVGAYHSDEPDFDVPLGQIDITDSPDVRRFLDEAAPDAVVNCAAMTDVDACEANPERAHAVNATAPTTVARWCEANDVWFGHVSTDYVFDGRTETPYAEPDSPNPLQSYGASKLSGERGVTDAMSTALVARLSFVWGVHRSHDELAGFPAWVSQSLRNGESLPLFTDQFVTPTRAGQAADVLLDLAEAGTSGLVHVAARSCVTPHEFGRCIRSQLENPAGTIRESSLSAVDRPAERPAYTCLAVERVERLRERPQPTLADDLEAIAGHI